MLPLPLRRALPRLRSKLRRINRYFASALLIASAVLAGFHLPAQTATATVGIILLMAVLAIASLWGLRLGLLAGALTGLAYDVFFIPPIYRLDIDDWRNALSLAIFCLASAVVSILAERLRQRAVAASRREVLAKRLSAMGQQLWKAADVSAIARIAVANIGVAFGAKTILLVPEGDAFKIAGTHPAGARLDHAELQAAVDWQQSDFKKISGAAFKDGLTRTLLPSSAALDRSALIIVGQTQRRQWQLPDRGRMIGLFAGQAAAALERVTLSTQVDDARIAVETEKMRSTLLTSISHDLKTPLSIILGSASGLQALNSSFSSRSAQDLLDSIVEEGERLDQFIANLLDMSRVESEAIRPRSQSVELGDIVGSALRRASRLLFQHHVRLDLPQDLPLLEADPVLMEKVLFNILENAAKYTPAGGGVALSASRNGHFVMIRISDEGGGIPEAELPHLFDKFYRVQTGEWKPAGTGLGLAISRGFLQAMGGSISAANRCDRSGAIFTIELPIASGESRSLSSRGAKDTGPPQAVVR